MSDTFGVDAYFELLNNNSNDETGDKDSNDFDLDNYNGFIGWWLLGFYFPRRSDVLLVNKVVKLINTKYISKKFTLKKSFKLILNDTTLTLKLRWICSEILKDI